LGAFKVEVIAQAETAKELSEMEKSHISVYQSNDPTKGYNLTSGGEGRIGPMPESWKKWKSGHSKKFWADPEYRAKQTQSHKEWWTPKRREDNAACLHLRRASGHDPRKGTGKGPGTGTKHSIETRVKLSLLKNKPVRCLNTNETFPSLTYVIERFGGCTGNLSRSIKKGHNFFGKRFEYAQ
jgi:hypothetical protein